MPQGATEDKTGEKVEQVRIGSLLEGHPTRRSVRQSLFQIAAGPSEELVRHLAGDQLKETVADKLFEIMGIDTVSEFRTRVCKRRGDSHEILGIHPRLGDPRHRAR